MYGFFLGLHDFGQQWRWRHANLRNQRTVRGFYRHDGDAHFRIGRDFLQGLAHRFRIFAGKNAAVYIGARHLRQGVWRVPSGQHGRHTSGVKKRVEVRHLRQPRDGRGIGRFLGNGAHVIGVLAGGKGGGLCKIVAGNLAHIDGERKILQSGQRRGKMIDGIVRRRHGTVPPGVQRFQLIIHVNFFAGLQSREQALVLVLFEFAAIQIDGVLRCDPVAVHGQQPIHAIGGAAFLVRSQREDQVAVGNIVFFLQANEARYQQSVAGLHVLGAAAVKIAVFLKKLKRIGSPIFAARFHNIQMPDEENRLARAAAVIAKHQILFVSARAGNLNILFVESGFPQPLGHGFGGGAHVADGVGGVDLDQLLEDLARQALIFRRRLCRRGIRGQ